MKANDGGQAFPMQAIMGGDGYLAAPRQDGMTLRDYFAAAALQGLLASFAGMKMPSESSAWSKDAYMLADAMLAERDRHQSGTTT